MKQCQTKLWVSTAASPSLSGRSARNTAPESALRSALHRAGLRYALNQQVIPRFTADIVFVRRRVAIFVDGCFWHGCPVHGRRSFSGPNAERWREKLRRNRRRDRYVERQAKLAGWTVLRLWECGIRSDLDVCVRRVRNVLRHD